MSALREPKRNNVLSNVENIVRKKSSGESPPAKAIDAEWKLFKKERPPFVSKSKPQVFLFSEDEDVQPFKSSCRNSDNDNNSSERDLKKFGSRNPEDDNDELTSLATRVNSINIGGGLDVAELYAADSELDIVSDNKKCVPRVTEKGYSAKHEKIKSKSQKENIDVTKRTPKPEKSKARKPKRKDSFIVSDDDSSNSDDVPDLTIYHRVLTKSIRDDVRKMTPKARSRKKIPTYDDRMFSASIVTKRSGSEYSSSDDEQDARVPSPLPSSSNLKNKKKEMSYNDSESVRKNSANDSHDLFSSSDPKKKDRERSTQPPPVSKKPFRKFSWISTDDESASDDQKTVSEQHIRAPPPSPSDSNLKDKKSETSDRVLTKSIRADVPKITPKDRSRKKIPTYDDRMFNAYIITKRSGSEYSSSEDELSTQAPPPLPLSSKLRNEKSETSDSDSESVDEIFENSSSSSDLFSSSDPKKKDCERLTQPPPVSKKPFRKFSWISTDDESSSDDQKSVPKVKEKSLSFLQSLSNPDSSLALHPDAAKYLKNFKKLKDELALKLFKMFNEEVFKNQLPSDLKIEWNARLTSCAGKCYNQRNKAVIGPNNECLRISRIVLSTKILESPDRLRDTLIHEMCHAAAWIIDKQSGGHGPLWKSWAAKAVRRYPELPSIQRCHNYSIKTKYKYRCVKCGYTIGRHSKSLKTDIQLCGYCHGVFELIDEKPAEPRTLPKFASFVKENFSKIKSAKPHLNHKDIMKELSENFASTKISN